MACIRSLSSRADASPQAFAAIRLLRAHRFILAPPDSFQSILDNLLGNYVQQVQSGVSSQMPQLRISWYIHSNIDKKTRSGNSNGTLEGALAQTFAPTVELLGFWAHLKAAGFIPGNPADLGAATLPQNPFGGLIGVNSLAIQGMPVGNKLCMNNVPGSAAIALDAQLDDGAPGTGSFRANLTAVPTATTAETVYSEANVYTVCIRI